MLLNLNLKKKKKSLNNLTWDDLVVKAVECGIMPKDFWEMTWREFSLIVLGNERKELNEWARTRNLAYIIYLSNSTEQHPKSLQSFWHIPQLDDVDTEENEVFLSNEELERTLKMYGVN